MKVEITMWFCDINGFSKKSENAFFTLKNEISENISTEMINLDK